MRCHGGLTNRRRDVIRETCHQSCNRVISVFVDKDYRQTRGGRGTGRAGLSEGSAVCGEVIRCHARTVWRASLTGPLITLGVHCQEDGFAAEWSPIRHEAPDDGNK